jgi:HEPN domain-containing protein
MNPNLEECEEWLRKARNDLVSARILLSHSDPVTDTACFHCQQSVEKTLKALLVFFGVSFEKVHSLSYLLDICEKQESRIATIRDKAERLAPYAVEVRYPGNFVEVTLAEAIDSLRDAEDVIKFVREILPQNLFKNIWDS